MPKLSDIQIRDPFVFFDGDDIFLFGSTDPNIWHPPGIGFDAYRSIGGSLTDWEGPHHAFRPPENFWSGQNFWAPRHSCGIIARI